MVNMKLIELALKQIDDLGKKAFTLHENCLKWREEPDEVEITKQSVECKQALEDQHKWICAILDTID